MLSALQCLVYFSLRIFMALLDDIDDRALNLRFTEKSQLDVDT